ncbi:type II toxin-antitoxin system VapB family antitoxin [Pusillimonas sp. ANT_WB101]|uniref:type II toxin-antitoxin system VapB family antitoxin n=1 Tax=Pusillimonas sp. ANT_WB101 TaxID=2597356 RepID=UPI0011EC0A98|nr:type II toxin-antitoxin system VapB family antitoxin [Pusillimonas sp. ANT_WB101]KAA0892715.1 type II toxin-antitoxin system VapB family antitoxin [Pusillimonas sp. ANT_WB101]
MRTTVTLNDKLLARARCFTGIQETSALLQLALRLMVEREAAQRLARLGGSSPDLKPIPRRQSEPGHDLS